MSVFSENLQKTIKDLCERYETRRSAILPVLHAIQDEKGWISPEAVEELHENYDLTRVHVKEVITFYDIYHDSPTRKHTIRFCGNLTCCMLGAKDSIKKIKERIAALEEKMGDDCPFGLEVFPCLGKCDGAPVMLVGKDRLEHATVDKVEELLEKYAPLS
jgi:NADH:ubiquinone oxidoreductase subunit E